MVKRKVSILDTAATAVAEISFFIESQGLPKTAKKFTDEAFAFFETLASNKVLHKPCTYRNWKELGYRCIGYKKKYVVAYLNFHDEVIICDFVSYKLLY